MSKMLFVKSNDYWGYDASQFDDAVNFYRFTWVVPEAMYETLDSDDQSSLNPCALFYVQGVTDNHNFLTLKIAQDGDEAKVSGMQGTKRRTRRYNIGSPAQYSVGSYALQEAPAGASSIEAIKEAVESGSTSEGSFNVSEFLTEAADIAAAVNMVTEDKSAETFAAPAEVPSGSAYEPADPTVANPATEGYSESDLVTMDEFSAMEYTPEIGGYPGLPVIPDSYGENSAGEGFGVPVWYGSAEGSEEYTFNFTVYDNATGEEIDNGEVTATGSNETEARNEAMRMLEEGGLDDEEFVLDAEGDSRLRDIRGKFMNRRKAKDAVFGEVMSQQMSGYYRTGIVGDNPPVGQNIARRNPAAKARYFIEPGVQNPNSGEWSKGPNFQQARKIAKGVAWDTVQDMGLAAETFNAELSNTPADYIFNRDNKLEQEIKGLQEEIDYLIDKRPITGDDRAKVEQLNRMLDEKYGERKALDKVHLGAEIAYAELGDQEFPVVPNSEGGNTALDSGYGVPQWYGSAETDEEDEYLCKYCGQDPDTAFADDFWDDGVCIPCAIEQGEYEPDEDYEAQSITETLEEAAPVSLKKPVLVAAVSALTGFLIARRRR